MSPAEAKMKARADALAAEQAQRAQANKIYQAEAAAKRQAGVDALAAEQAQRAAQPVFDNRQLGGQGLTQTPLAQRQLIINQVQGGPASRMGQSLEMMPVAQRQAAINAAQGGPAQYYGQALTNPLQPQGPVRPPVAAPRIGVPGAAAQMRAPQPRGPVRPPQQMAQPQARPEPTFMQQYGGIIQPLASAGIGALFKNLF